MIIVPLNYHACFLFFYFSFFTLLLLFLYTLTYMVLVHTPPLVSQTRNINNHWNNAMLKSPQWIYEPICVCLYQNILETPYLVLGSFMNQSDFAIHLAYIFLRPSSTSLWEKRNKKKDPNSAKGTVQQYFSGRARNTFTCSSVFIFKHLYIFLYIPPKESNGHL